MQARGCVCRLSCWNKGSVFYWGEFRAAGIHLNTQQHRSQYAVLQMPLSHVSSKWSCLWCGLCSHASWKELWTSPTQKWWDVLRIRRLYAKGHVMSSFLALQCTPDKSHKTAQCISWIFRAEECDLVISAATSRMYKSPGNILEKLIYQGNIEVITALKGLPVNI